ncbi:hypothetical protein BDZ94DRAFT_1311685 [Collybia nuda]|uniref:Uncharacterized protein n=1 Tax=Collybia nuda TaxID=64659 RepID=A0A9P6CC42_9AGAR|nr:hypothetical protein BDZ94DRAFT_1311685 [Collybia nuda]
MSCNPTFDSGPEEFLGLLVRAIVFTFFYGIHMVLFFHSMATSWKKGISRRNQKASLSLYTLTFLLATFIEVTVLVVLARHIHLFLFGCGREPPTGGIPFAVTTATTGIIEFIETLCFFAEMSINNGLLMWRAYVLSQSKRWILILPFVLLPGFFVTFVVLTMLSPITEIDTLFSFATVVSSVANLVATCLIGYVYWIHKKEMAIFFNGETRRSKAASILSTYTGYNGGYSIGAPGNILSIVSVHI